MIGTILHDRWHILSVLGHGAMGEVFLADNVKLGRKEAVKILMPLLAADPLFVRRFRREARAVNRLRHPNIVALYDFGQLLDERFFLSMEYAQGEGLHLHRKRATRFTIPRALHVLDQLVRAVHHAHSRGVVHRDLKPENLILVGNDEDLKVLDFGIAKIVAPDHQESVALSSDRQLWGTPAYMSPERASGVGDDPRSDLYSIGCIGYELVAGGPPFRGNPAEILYAHTTQDPVPPSMHRGEPIPSELEAVILRCLEKDPARRYQSAAELYAALRQVPGYPAAKATPRRRFASLSAAETVDQPQTAPYANLRGTLRRLAEALLDKGVNDPRLVGGVAILRDHEQIVARLEAVQDALEHESDALRETILDREASLRFALGELALVGTGPDAPSDVQDLARDLELRLDAVAEEATRLQDFEQNIEAIAQTRAERLTKLQSCYDALGQVVNELLPAHLDDETVHTLAANLALARSTSKGRRS
ncbi:MAG: serine/threonine-protein kinase [Kofleriaceae bacterium]